MFYFVAKTILYMEKSVLTIPEQIKKALDGRTQRWLSFEVRIAESDLSRKMNDGVDFTDEEISRIEDRLGCTIILPSISK